MKLLSFHLMPHRHLPSDFTRRHRSVWVDIDPSLYDPQLGHRQYNDYLDELELAAAAGFDGICVNEHHQNAYGLMPSPNLMAATLARNTSDAAVTVMGNSLALYSPPTRVAEELAMIDVISGGRLIAGMPVGTAMDTCYGYGIPPATLRDRYEEAHDLITRAWSAQQPFAFNGRFTKLRYVNPWPRPVQHPPPIWIPGGGTVETWEWCAAHNYVYCYLSYFGYKLAEPTMRRYWDRMAEIGRDPNPFQAGFLQFAAVADTDAEALAIYGEAIEYFFNRCLHAYPGFADPPGYKTERTLRAGVEAQMSLAMKKSTGGAYLTAKDMVDKGYVVAGSPATVAERLDEVARSLNVGHLMLLLQFGNMPTELARHNITLFAERVAPEIAGRFEGQWQDAWWPAGCSNTPRVLGAQIATSPGEAS
jgi:alkanesulfonate monooxygenase SsuD/methylene tetrahydromethanopterin reductase-like flavin-dependent oxidoreductase (luciferase family)